MHAMQSAHVGITTLSSSFDVHDDSPAGQVWLFSVNGAAPGAQLHSLISGIGNPGFGGWRVHLAPSGQPVAVAMLDARLRSAPLLLWTDEHSQPSAGLPSALQSLAVLGDAPCVVLLGHEDIKADLRDQAARLGLHRLQLMRADAGPARLASALRQISALRAAHRSGPLRMQALAVLPGSEPAVYGELLQGSVAPGDAVRLLPSGQIAQVRAVAGPGPRMPRCGQSLTLSLSEPADVRGVDLVTAANDPVESADTFQVRLSGDWADAETAGADWHACTGPARRWQRARLTDVQPLPAGGGFSARMQLDQPVPFATCDALLPLRLFSLHPGKDAPAVAAGRLLQPCRVASNIHRQAVSVDKAARARHKRQQPCVVWLTGLSGAGKSTIANLVEQALLARGLHTYLLDGDNVRHGLNRDLGFSDQDRAENIRRVAEVAKLMVDAGLIVITAFISPFRAERELARQLVAGGEFLEVHVDTPLALAEQRDVKGLYRKARRGELKGFTGIDAPYEAPERPELRIDTRHGRAEDGAAAVLDLLLARGVIGAVPGA